MGRTSCVCRAFFSFSRMVKAAKRLVRKRDTILQHRRSIPMVGCDFKDPLGVLFSGPRFLIGSCAVPVMVPSGRSTPPWITLPTCCFFSCSIHSRIRHMKKQRSTPLPIQSILACRCAVATGSLGTQKKKWSFYHEMDFTCVADFPFDEPC